MHIKGRDQPLGVFHCVVLNSPKYNEDSTMKVFIYRYNVITEFKEVVFMGFQMFSSDFYGVVRVHRRSAGQNKRAYELNAKESYQFMTLAAC